MIEITGEQAIEALRKVVAGNEDRTAECIYIQAGKPSCIVAQALTELGVSLDALSDLDASSGNAFYGDGLGDLAGVVVTDILLRHNVLLDEKAYNVFSVAQLIQDEGWYSDPRDSDRSWGLALKRAEKVYADAS